jgi:Sulfotransferase family
VSEQVRSLLVEPVSRITSVSLERLDYERLLGGNIDWPMTERVSQTYELDFGGWVVGRTGHAVAIEFVHDDTCHLSLPVGGPRPDVARAFPAVPGVESSGFYTAFNSLRFPSRFTIEVVAALSNGDRARFATLKGDRSELTSSAEPRYRPLMLTSLGRSGSSLLVRLLASHPEILGYRPFEYEPRIASYWFGVLMELSSPKSYVEQIDPRGAVESHDWWIGDHGLMAPPLGDRLEPELRRWLGADRIRDLAAMCQDRIDDLYGAIAKTTDKHAGCFIEKTLPTNLTSLILEVYEDASEVILVRDFRDMVASSLAYAQKRNGRGLGRELASSEESYVRDQVRNSVLRLVRALHRRSARSHVIRYEDLVRDPADALRRLLADLGLDRDPETLRSTFETYRSMTPDWAGVHRTTEDPAASIGRWREDLSSEVQAACNDALGFGLAAFGYEI